MKRKIMAVLLSAALVMSSAVPVFAIDDPGNVYSDGDTHDVSGGDEGVGAVGEDTVVNVTGNVTGTVSVEVPVPGEEFSNYINGATVAVDGAEINVNGDVGGEGSAYGARAVEGTINIEGNVTGMEESISAEDGSTVIVDGNADGSVVAENSTVQITGKLQGTTVDVAGDPDEGSFAYPAIRDFNSKIVVNGNVSSGSTAIETRGGSTIVIGGVLTSSSSEPVIILNEEENAGVSTIIVHQIEGNTANLVKAGHTTLGYHDEETQEYVPPVFTEDATLKNSQLNNIFYIIRTAADSVANILGFNNTTIRKEGYDVAKAGTELKISVKEGYGLTAGTIAVTKNADGTYTLTVPQGGGVTLTAEQIQEAVEEAEQQDQQPTQPAAQPEQPAAQPEQPAAQPEQPAAQPEQPAAQPEQPAAPVGEDKKEEEHQSSSSTQDQNALWPTAGTVVLAGYDEATALDPAGDPAAYVSAFVDKIANTPQGGTAELFVTDAAYLDDTIVQALVARSDVAVKLNVTVNGQALVINIPAGYNLSRLIGKGGKISMKKLIDLFVQKK